MSAKHAFRTAERGALAAPFLQCMPFPLKWGTSTSRTRGSRRRGRANEKYLCDNDLVVGEVRTAVVARPDSPGSEVGLERHAHVVTQGAPKCETRARE